MPIDRRVVGAFVFLALVGMPMMAAAIELSRLGADGEVPAFSVVEWSVRLDRAYDNPFDPDRIAVDAVMTDPRGATRRVPGYWHEPPPESGSPAVAATARGGFRVRFAPEMPGRWSIRVVARDAKGERASADQPFVVAESAAPGFYRRAANGRYFARDSGAPWFMVGINLAWSPRGLQPTWYEQWFARLARHGGNFARVWMCHGSGFIERPEHGAGRFDAGVAAFYDDLLERAARHDIGIMLCLLNHRDFLDRDRWGSAEWPNHPYNAANGGPAATPAEFFTHPEARRLFRNRLRYQIARFGAFTSLAFWELFNEQEFAGVPVPDAWNAEMAGFLREHDPYGRLITTSAHVPEAVWRLQAMDLTQSHIYGDGTQIDAIGPIVARARQHERFGKPHLLAEFGIDYKGHDGAFDPAGVGTTFHNALWAGMFSGGAGAGAYWWWDGYVEPNRLYERFAPIAKFAAMVDWANTGMRPVELAPVVATDDAPETFEDLVLRPGEGWGRSHGEPIVVSPAGRATLPMPVHLYGPAKPDLRVPTTLRVEMPSDGEMRIEVTEVSDFAAIRVSVDGEPQVDLPFSALPGAPDLLHSEPKPQYEGIRQATLAATRTVALKRGRREITLDNIAGDWVKIGAVVFSGARSSRFPPVIALALRDEQAGEAIVWLCDERSNWMSDRDGMEPAAISAVAVDLPMGRDGAYEVAWFDTRAGVVARTDRVAADAGTLRLAPPEFRRDIAARVAPAR